MRVLPIVTAIAFAGATLAAQQPVPQPFPKPGQPPRPSPPAPAPQPPPAPPAPAPQPAPPPAAPSPKAATEPAEPALGAPVYPGAQLIGSFDAGRGQRFYLFGTNTGFAEVVAYYRSALRPQKGDKVFDEPAMHMFATGRFREETMGFPPSVTVKDYTWNRSEGYLNPRPGSGPARFKTVIQIVPAPPGQPAK